MKLSAPKLMTYFFAVALLIVGIIARFVPTPGVSPNAFWIVVVSDVLLIIGCSVKGF
jgi:hypothetical protein